MFKLLALLIFVLVEVSTAWAQPVPAEIKSTVGFIYVAQKVKEKVVHVPNGTCFFVGVQIPQTETFYVYAVTAKHVLEADHDTHRFFDQIFIRINTKDGRSRMLPLNLSLEGPNKNVFLHYDSTVDIAVIRDHPDDGKDDFKFLPDNLIMTKEDVSALSITEGSEVFFTGLFTSHVGQRRNNPIVRFGRMALMTDEKILWDRDQMVELYLVESASYGGNSGSPVFLFLGPERTAGQFIVGGRLIKLAGVMQGSFGEFAPIGFRDTANTPVARQSVGIAAVVPAYKLKEILFGGEAKARRGF
jgi:hypothetical protein